MQKLWTGFVASALMLAAGTVMAGTPASASMVVTGHIVIGTSGGVIAYRVDKMDALPPGARKELTKVIPTWKFTPVLRDGEPVVAKSYMSIRLLATPAGNGQYAIGVSGAHFGKPAPGTSVTYKHREPPSYPRRAVAQHVSGAVYLVVEVGRDGKVHHVAARQVNLFVRGRKASMKHWRHELARASVQAARNWTFQPPVKGPHAHDSHWVVAIPVVFHLRAWGQGPVSRHGQWQSYLPGPKHYVPWLAGDRLAAMGADAIPSDGGVFPLQQKLQLLTKLGGSG